MKGKTDTTEAVKSVNTETEITEKQVTETEVIPAPETKASSEKRPLKEKIKSAPKDASVWAKGMGKHLKTNWLIYTFFIIPVIYYVIFRYIPMFGNIIAFRKYQAGGPIFGVEWSGFKYFKQFLGDPAFLRAFKNTLVLNISYLAVRFPLTLIFALLLNEIKWMPWKKFVQTVSYLPHFISMVIVAGMIKELLSTSGPINNLLVSFGHEAIEFISLPEWFTTIFVTSGIWQGLGWGSILYLAAIAGINPELYEAAKVDGANHFQQIIHVTIPCILPTITTLLILDIGGMVGSSGAFEKVFLLYNPMTYETSDIVSTYVYRMGVHSGNYSYATAVGLFEGLINLILLTIANFTSKKVAGESLW
ncbi:MAG: ABC transporter permease subunit [Lachnospiraceae bacterium]|nr:ABC transporter permease subunit [Lachnospiraceae bacterium]